MVCTWVGTQHSMAHSKVLLTPSPLTFLYSAARVVRTPCSLWSRTTGPTSTGDLHDRRSALTASSVGSSSSSSSSSMREVHSMHCPVQGDHVCSNHTLGTRCTGTTMRAGTCAMWPWQRLGLVAVRPTCIGSCSCISCARCAGRRHSWRSTTSFERWFFPL